jgi:ubiquinone/menaquinone biosynthesis C-methylase UbiE
MQNHNPASPQPSPNLLFETLNAYQRSAAVKAAIELDLFSAIARGASTASAVAQACSASERGTRILLDYLVICGFLEKSGEEYSLTPDSAFFLDRQSPAYMGNAAGFLLSPMLTGAFQDMAEVVQTGTTLLPPGGSVAPDHPVWVDFARSMGSMMKMPAMLMAQLLDLPADRPLKILDIAAGHGIFGITVAQKYSQAQVVAQDWANVLQVATENAQAAGISDRHSTLPGDAFEVEFGEGYDLVLLTNFLHHFDVPTCESLLRKIHAALAPQGQLLTLEFIPNADRVSPPNAAAFSLIMLATTPSGDAYTFDQLDKMLKNAGFSQNTLHALEPTPQSVVLSRK